MSRVALSALKLLEDYTFTGERADKIGSDAAVAGARAAPSQTTANDKHIGVRLNYGETFNRCATKVRYVRVQPNKGADNQSLKELVANDSHQVVAEVFIPVDSADPQGSCQRDVRGSED